MLAFACFALTFVVAVDPPTLDELLEDADVEDRRRIERAIYSIDRTIDESIALEEQLARKMELLQPLPIRDAIAIGFALGFVSRRRDLQEGAELRVAISLSLDLERLDSIHRRAPIPRPGAEETRRSRCLALNADVADRVMSSLEERAARERARALGCEWGSR